jgi:hypothetical protein
MIDLSKTIQHDTVSLKCHWDHPGRSGEGVPRYGTRESMSALLRAIVSSTNLQIAPPQVVTGLSKHKYDPDIHKKGESHLKPPTALRVVAALVR